MEDIVKQVSVRGCLGRKGGNRGEERVCYPFFLHSRIRISSSYLIVRNGVLGARMCHRLTAAESYWLGESEAADSRPSQGPDPWRDRFCHKISYVSLRVNFKEEPQ